MTSAVKTSPLDVYQSVMYDAMDLVEVRCLLSSRTGKAWMEWVLAEDLPDMSKSLRELNDRGMNVYAGVMPRKGRGGTEDEDCLPGRVMWADFDGVEPRAAVRRVRQAEIPNPTLIVNSGHGTHLYWRLQEKIAPDVMKQLVYDLGAALRSDEKVYNPSRILRLPGYWNTKEPESWVKCEIVRFWPENVFPYSEVRAILPPNPLSVTGEAFPELPQGKLQPHSSEAAERARAYIDRIAATTGGRDNAAYKVACVLGKDFDLDEVTAALLLREWNLSHCLPPLTEGELSKVFYNAQTYSKKDRGNKVQDQPKREEPRRARAQPRSKPEEEGRDISDRVTQEIEEEISGVKKLIRLPWTILRRSVPFLTPGKLGIITGLPGTAKSFFSLHLCRTVGDAGMKWAYLPLEDTREYHVRRMAALVKGDWEIAQHFRDLPERKREGTLRRIREEYADLIQAVSPGIQENPTIQGNEVKPVDSNDILEWAEERCEEGCRLLVIDPLAQIEFDGREEWRSQASFVRSLIGIANCSKATIVLVVHRSKVRTAGIYGTEGSKRLVDLAFSVLSVEHNWEPLEVETKDGEEEMEFNRILTVDKCRDGDLSEARLAFQFGESGPSYRELGKIVRKKPNKYGGGGRRKRG